VGVAPGTPLRIQWLPAGRNDRRDDRARPDHVQSHKALDARLAGKPCKSYGANVKILTPGNVRYPDALVTCTPTDPNAVIADNPVVVFEVVSEDSARTDRVEKLREYQATETIRRYVIHEQRSIGAVVFTRRGNDWIATALTEGDTLHMPEIDIEMTIDEFYAGLDYSSPAEAEPRT
jgi:Uma2 family endonuclease